MRRLSLPLLLLLAAAALLIARACADPSSSPNAPDRAAAPEDAAHAAAPTFDTPPIYREPGEVALTRVGLQERVTADGRIWIPAEEPFVDAVLMGEDAAPDELRVRALLADGTWTPEQNLEITWQEEQAFVARIPIDADATGLELRVADERLPDFLLIDFLEERPDWTRPLLRDLPFEEEGSEPPVPLPPLDHAGAGEGILQKNLSFVITRAQWGARNTGSCGSFHSPTHMTIHHTATPNNDSLSPAARMRQMQAYHVDALGWCDFGYHFTVGIDGRVYRGRVSEQRLGSHVGGHNTNNVGVSVVGNFVAFSPRQVQLDGLRQIGAWLTSTYPIPLNRTRIRGHRDWPGHTSNACPGARLYAQLGSIIEGFGGGAPTCTNACTPGARRCTDGEATQRCADHDGDGCTTWGTAEDCGCGEFCADGACVRDPAVCCPAPVAGGGEIFADLVPGSWGEEIASLLLDRDITSGCQPDPPLFCPNCQVTRGQAAAFLARALELDTTQVVDPPSFEDVPTTHSFHGAIEALYAEELIAGCATDPLRYCPADPMPRGTAAGLLARAADLEPVAAQTPVFEDVPEDAWYRPALETAHRQCMVSGCATEPLSFCPNTPVTRVQFGALLINFLELDEQDAGTCCRPEAIEGASASFGDMLEGRDESAAAEALLRAGITQGCSAGPPALFCGACALERGAAAAFLVRALNFETVEVDAPTFVDVPLDHRFSSAIETLAARGLVTGCDPDAGRFCPADTLTRATAASLLDRVLLVSERDGPQTSFDDVPADAWYGDAVRSLAGGCVIDGCDDDKFCPGDAVLRESFGLWIARALELEDFENCLVPLDEVGSEEARDSESESGSESGTSNDDLSTESPSSERGSADSTGSEPGSESGASEGESRGSEDTDGEGGSADGSDHGSGVQASGGGCAQTGGRGPLGGGAALALLGLLAGGLRRHGSRT